jgi:hypothetical protein
MSSSEVHGMAKSCGHAGQGAPAGRKHPEYAGAAHWTAVFFHRLYTYAAQVVASGVQRSPLIIGLEYVPYILAAAVVAILWRPKGAQVAISSCPARYGLCSAVITLPSGGVSGKGIL